MCAQVSPASGPLTGGTSIRVSFVGFNTGVASVALGVVGQALACVLDAQTPGVAVCTTPVTPAPVQANYTSTCLVVTVQVGGSSPPPPVHASPMRAACLCITMDKAGFVCLSMKRPWCVCGVCWCERIWVEQLSVDTGDTSPNRYSTVGVPFTVRAPACSLTPRPPPPPPRAKP